jgi:hypothetical protein
MVAERELMILVVATSVVTTGVVGFALCTSEFFSRYEQLTWNWR